MLVRGLVRCSLQGRKESDMTWQLNNNKYSWCYFQIQFFFYWLCFHSMWDLEFPNRRLNLSALQWKLGVLTSGPPGKSFRHYFIS